MVENVLIVSQCTAWTYKNINNLDFKKILFTNVTLNFYYYLTDGEVDDEKDQVTPCAYTECAPNSYCYPQQVQCIRFPCPGRATCVNNLETCTYQDKSS